MLWAPKAVTKPAANSGRMTALSPEPAPEPEPAGSVGLLIARRPRSARVPAAVAADAPHHQSDHDDDGHGDGQASSHGALDGGVGVAGQVAEQHGPHAP